MNIREAGAVGGASQRVARSITHRQSRHEVSDPRFFFLSHYIVQETFFQRLGIVHGAFDLYESSKLTNRELLIISVLPFDWYTGQIRFHRRYTLQNLTGMVEELQEVNGKWQHRFDEVGSYFRYFHVLVRPMD